MASSYAYWNFTEKLSGELAEIAKAAGEAYGVLESNDDPGEIADLLSDIKKRTDKVSDQIGAAVPAFKKTSAVLETIPAFKES